MPHGSQRTWSQLCLMSDYGAPTPLWSDAGSNLADLAPLCLRPHLAGSLLAWQHHFDEHFHYDRQPHWDSPADADWYAAEGVRLHDRLCRAMPGVEITMDVWPVTGEPPGS